MGGKLGSVWERLLSSFWFIPGLICVGAVLLFFLTQYLDQVARESLSGLPILFAGGAQAARSVLSTIAGGLITSVTTAFSLTITTLTLASTNYSPRVLRSFTEDRGLQVVLGMYTATFLYSLLVLRIVRTPDSQGAVAFVPVISVTTAVVLTILCVALLVYFFAHVVSLIQSSSISKRAHEEAIKTVNRLQDLRDGSNAEEDPEDRPGFSDLPAGEGLVVRAEKSGYIQYLNPDAVADELVGADAYRDAEKVFLEIPFGPGNFVAAGLPIAKAWPARGEELDPKVRDGVRDAFYVGRERSFRQDFAFGLRQLSDIALKGLSPGVNDPTTAMQAMDRAEAIFVALGNKALPARIRERDVKGTEVLIKIGYYGFDDAVGLAFDQVRLAAFTSGQVAFLERLLEVLERAIDANPLPARRRSLWARAMTIARQAPEQIVDPDDAANLCCRAVRVGSRLLGTGLGPEVEADLEEVCNLAEGLSRGGERVREAARAAREERSPDRRVGS